MGIRFCPKNAEIPPIWGQYGVVKSDKLNIGREERVEDEKSATLFLHIEGMRGEQMASEFTDYMRKILQRKGVSQQQMFRSADISEKYGYKLVSGEKHTRQRDLIIKMCIAAHFTREELSEALILYGMAPLYTQNGRDKIMLQALEEGMSEIADINDLLEKDGFGKLYESKREK